jgi:hypothetical protein
VCLYGHTANGFQIPAILCRFECVNTRKRGPSRLVRISISIVSDTEGKDPGQNQSSERWTIWPDNRLNRGLIETT